jgi:hypothetical protein
MQEKEVSQRCPDVVDKLRDQPLDLYQGKKPGKKVPQVEG